MSANCRVNPILCSREEGRSYKCMVAIGIRIPNVQSAIYLNRGKTTGFRNWREMWRMITVAYPPYKNLVGLFSSYASAKSGLLNHGRKRSKNFCRHDLTQSRISNRSKPCHTAVRTHQLPIHKGRISTGFRDAIKFYRGYA